MKHDTGKNMSRPHIWDEAFDLVGQFEDKRPEPEEQEIAFRQITEEPPRDPGEENRDGPHEAELSVKDPEIPYELHPGEISFGKGDTSEDYEKEISFRNAAAPLDLADINSTKSAKNLYYETQHTLFKIFHLIKDNQDFDIDSTSTFTRDMVAHIKVEANSWMQLLYKIEKDTAPDAVMHIVKHALDTAIIAIRLGIGLKLDDDSLESLALQTCFHNVGMLKLPPELILKQGRLSRDEIAHIRKHPEYGYAILRKFEEPYSGIAEIIYQVHERYDGSGYPRGLKGKDIPDNSLIIGISNMFAALLHPRPYRPRRLPFEAIKEIIAAAKEQFPKHIIKALVNEFSAFPEGLYVRLNSNEVGKVITVNRLAPLSPVVEILYNGQGKLREPKIVDLMKDHCLYIASGFYGEEE